MTTKTAKEASMYEPRVGDLVSVEGTACVVIAKVTGGIGVRWADGRGALLGWGFAPLRPDAPGQRVRHEGSPVLVGRVARDAVDGVVEVAWEAGYGRSFHEPGRLIRIADQAPRAMTPAEVGAATHAALVAPGSSLLDAAAAQWARTVGAPSTAAPLALPTCQHCGSGIVAGLLRDTCPRWCDLTLRAAEPEPDHVGTRLVPMRCGHEAVWIARGRGAIGTPHPTREGAIAAWREAVRANGGSGARP